MHLVCFCGGDGEDRFAIRVRDLRGMLTMVGPEMTDLPGLRVAIVGLWLAIRGLGAEGLNYDDMEKLDEAEQLKHAPKTRRHIVDRTDDRRTAWPAIDLDTFERTNSYEIPDVYPLDLISDGAEGRVQYALGTKRMTGKLDLGYFTVDASGAIEHATTMQAATASPHWRLSNVAGVHVYETARGWYADIVFEGLPVGVPTVIGNAVPCGTREEAMRSAVRNLSLCAEREKAVIANFDTMMRWFMFDEIEVPVDPGYLPGIAAKLAAEGYTQEECLGRLAYLRTSSRGTSR